MRTSLLSTFALALVLVPLAARADEREACVAAVDEGQKSRDAGKLAEAREKFLFCAREACPKVVSKQCTVWAKEVEDAQPTVTIRATASSKDVTDVEVQIDGQVVTSSLDGRPLTVDPGPHTFRYARAGVPPVEDKVVIRMGEKNRVLDVRLDAEAAPPSTPPPAAPPASRPFRVGVPAIVSASIGVAGFVTMGILAGTAASDQSTLRSTCAPNCDPAAVDDINTRIVLANVAAAVGIAGVAGAVLFLVLDNVGGRPEPAKTGLRFTATPTVAGAWAGLSGAF